MDPFGSTRASIQVDHALITPDTHVAAPLPGWGDAAGVIHISPALGARFTQYTVEMQAGGESGPPAPNVERFVYVRSGRVSVTAQHTATLSTGGYAFFPSGTTHKVQAEEPATLVVFEKPYQPSSTAGTLALVIGNEDDVAAESFGGDPDKRLQMLLPDQPEYDLAVNIFSFQPGATLPQVEVHVMEHGLIFLDGAGVYRLGDRWYPVAAGDVIWMRAYCPQWFVACGKTPARYLYYKDVNRDPLEAGP